jgi:shikimate 5-dehydrogenase
MTRELFHFVGVSTGGSSIMRLFPRWADLLGIDAGIEGRDIPLDAPPERYRAAIAEIAARPEVRGALVTTHKVAVYRHARDLFAELDRDAVVCEEISCVAKRDGALTGFAKDPVTARRTIEEMVDPNHFAAGSADGPQVLCLGAGGAGVAVTLALLSLPCPPGRVLLTDVDAGRLAAAERAHAHLAGPGRVEYRKTAGSGDADALLAALPPGSLVINATGMGKDRPGSPVSDRARFPRDGIAWDLNYRGDLDFLRQARARAGADRLTVYDGWRYFLHGWTEHIAEAFGLDLTPARFDALATAATPFRPR